MFKSRGALYNDLCSETVQLSKEKLICTYQHSDIIARYLLQTLEADRGKMK